MSRRVVAAGRLQRPDAAAPVDLAPAMRPADVVTLYRPPKIFPPAPRSSARRRERFTALRALLARLLGGRWSGYAAPAAR